MTLPKLLSMALGLVLFVAPSSAWQLRAAPRLRATTTAPAAVMCTSAEAEQQCQPGKLSGMRSMPMAGMAALALLPIIAAPTAAHAAVVPALGDSSFVPSFSLIFLSEIGDKTFFIAALLAARTSRLLTFAGCGAALALMTVISVIIGQVFHAVPASITRGLPIDDYVAIASFVYFGVKSLIDAREIEDDGAGIAEEREDAEKTLEDAGTSLKGGWPLVAEAFTLTTVAEIGDRSQIATIALAAAGNPLGVAGGAIAGHFLATGTAVIGGAYLSKFLSERAILIIGGVLFLIFALTTALGVF